MTKGIDLLKEVLKNVGHSTVVEVLDVPLKGMDGLLYITEIPLYVLNKNQVLPIDVLEIEKQIKKHDEIKDCIVVANYISPKAKEILKDKKIHTLDKAGNIHLSIPYLLINIEGHKNESTAEIHKNRAYTKTGAAVIFQFLMNPKVVNESQREIALKAGVSLGTIPKVFAELLKEGYLVRVNQKEFQLVQYQKLLNKWGGILKEKILPAQYMHRFSPIQKTAQQFLKEGTLKGDTQWGGEPAAEILTNYIHPEIYSIFTSLTISELMKKYKLVPANDGGITVYQKFWNHSEYNDSIVDPVLIYAHLMAYEDSRSIETAQIIYNDYIQPKL